MGAIKAALAVPFRWLADASAGVGQLLRQAPSLGVLLVGVPLSFLVLFLVAFRAGRG